LITISKSPYKLLILGSGPSILSIIPYLDRFENIMVINGAIKLVPNATYMISQDRAANKQEWFNIPTPNTKRYLDYMIKDSQPHTKWYPIWMTLSEYQNNPIKFPHFRNNESCCVLSKELLLKNRSYKKLYGHFSSATFALDLAYTLGYEDVYLCGIDMCKKERVYYKGLNEDESIYSIIDTKKFRYPVTEYQYYCIPMLNQMIDIYNMNIIDLSDGNLKNSKSVKDVKW